LLGEKRIQIKNSKTKQLIPIQAPKPKNHGLLESLYSCFNIFIGREFQVKTFNIITPVMYGI
jgi:hypothetical protein